MKFPPSPLVWEIRQCPGVKRKLFYILEDGRKKKKEGNRRVRLPIL